MRALVMLKDGLLPHEVAQRLGVDRRSVRRWKAAAREGGGREALRARPAPGRPAKLGARELRKLETLLLRGPLAAGFPTDLWTCPRVAEVIERSFAVHYHVDSVGRLLHELGWSPQKPVRRAVWGYAKTNPLANFAPVELDELVAQTELTTIAIAQDQPLLRSMLSHCPLSLCLK